MGVTSQKYDLSIHPLIEKRRDLLKIYRKPASKAHLRMSGPARSQVLSEARLEERHRRALGMGRTQIRLMKR